MQDLNINNNLLEINKKLDNEIEKEKYNIALEFINKILNNINKPKIKELTEFTNIDREDIIKEINIGTLKEMENEIFKFFNKKKCGYYRKTDALVLNCLRSMMKELE